MKTPFACFIGTIVFLASVSCSSDTEVSPAPTPENPATDSIPKATWFPKTNYDTLRGFYTGDFGDGFINLVLTYVNDKKAIGYNVHKGLQRNISGPVVQKENSFELTLNEPGDNPYDGIFVLMISKKDGSVQASWKANDPKIKPKTFQLKKRFVKENNDSKEFYEGGEMTEENLIDIFSLGYLNGGHIEFKENGMIRFSYYPDKQENAQQEIIKGSWKFANAKNISVEWAKNKLFKTRLMKFKLVRDEDGVPTLEGPDSLVIFPDIY